MIRKDSAELEVGKGIVGDRYHLLAQQYLEQGKQAPANHLSLVSEEELDAFMANHDLALDYGDFRRSIIIRDMDLNALVGKRFRLGTAICFGEELCEPCSYLARTVHQSVLPELQQRAGLRASVLESGTIEVGSEIEAMQESEDQLTRSG